MSSGEIVDTVVGPARLRRSNRKTLAIAVHPDGRIQLTAPARSNVEQLLAKVAKRASWISRQRREFAAMNGKRTPLRYTSGATHRYLGKQYRLKVTRGDAVGVKLVGGYLHVVTSRPDVSETEHLLGAWMRKRALEQLSRRVEAWRAWCHRQRLPVPRMSLRAMSKRWGSAQRDGKIMLNPDLVRVPSVCIDYVVAHEICHLKHPHHGSAFYRQLDGLLPNWRNAKARLEHAEL